MPRGKRMCKGCGKHRGTDGALCADCLQLATDYVGADAGRLKRLYSISARFHGRLFARQRGLCAICKRSEQLVVDHDHETGKVRGLLCNQCNLGLGLFRDDPFALTEAVDYLFRPPAHSIDDRPVAPSGKTVGSRRYQAESAVLRSHF